MIANLALRKTASMGWLLPALLIFYVLICCTQLRGYLNWSSFNFIIGLIGLPFVLGTGARSGSPLKYTATVLLFCLIYVVLPVKTALYFAIVTACLFLYASTGGR